MAHTISGASLSGIYDRLNKAPKYHPLEADTFADWSIEAGDIVTVSRDGNDYQSPVQSTSLTWRRGQSVTVSSTGNQERDAISKVSQHTYNSGSSGLRATQKTYDSVLVSYNNMVSGLEAGVGWATLYASNLYTQMKAGLYLTSSTAHLYVDSAYTQMSSGLYLTSSTAHLYVDNKYTQMSAGLMLTSSTAHLYVDNKYTQMSAGLKLTSSSAHVYVDNRYLQMTAGLKLTSSSAHVYVDNKYTQMSAGLRLTSSSFTNYVSGRTTRAYIIGKINTFDDTSEVLIGADKVSVDGSTTINDVFGVSNNYIWAKKSMYMGSADDQNITLNASNGSITAKNYIVGLGNSIDFRAAGATTHSLTSGDVAGMIIKADVDNGTLKLWRHGADPDGTPTWSFNKAISSWTGTWNGRRLKVTASPQNQSTYFYLYSTFVKSGAATHTTEGSNHYATQTLNIYSDEEGDDQDAGTKLLTSEVSILANDVYSAGYAVSDAQVSMGSYDKIPTAAGSSAVSGRKDMGTISMPSVSTYLTFNITVHGHVTRCYVTLTA